ncbi:MAG TPA: CaiB/BaiF CoA-transferase family protein [Acidimicrobiia bacterium]|nr:CaiB/BaiF CoA-transferase family protein [Acidimicrobiia bacterium]
MPGPLDGVTVTELAGLGPVPFAGMVLADLGAAVVRIERAGGGGLFAHSPRDVLSRGRLSVAVDLKSDRGREVVLRSVAASEVLIEGFRPGVTERLGIGPAHCLARNPALVYGRMTGWGQDGPLAGIAGHDIDYIAVSGALHAIGPAEEPIPPLNLVGDFGGGGMLLVVGVLAALVHARATGVGQIVDAAMTDGSALLTASHHGYMADGWWKAEREANLLDGAAPFYSTYRTSDDRHVAVGALEPQFFATLLERLDIDPDDIAPQNDRDGWPAMRELFRERFATRTRDEWASHFEGTDACVAPVLSLAEAPDHPHNVSRGTFVDVAGVVQPAPAPRFSVTHTEASPVHGRVGQDTDHVLTRLGFDAAEIAEMRDSGSVA